MRTCTSCDGKGYIRELKDPELFDKLFDRYDITIPAGDACYNKALNESGGMVNKICSFCKGKGYIEFIEIEKYDKLVEKLDQEYIEKEKYNWLANQLALKEKQINKLEDKLFGPLENEMCKLILSDKENFIKIINSNNGILSGSEIEDYLKNLFTTNKLQFKDIEIKCSDDTTKIYIVNADGIEKNSKKLLDIIDKTFKELNVIWLGNIPF